MSETFQLALTITATPHEIFQALTQSDELMQWFVEHADVSLANGDYTFWGSLTPEAPGLDQGHHRLLSWKADRSLSFVWPMRGAETSVTFTLEDQQQATRVLLVHEGVPERKSGEASFSDFWEISLENLRGWVERRVVGARCDFSEQHTGDVHLAIDIAAPPDTVFHALVTPGELNRYFATQAVVEPYVGGRYDFGWGDGGPVKILELDSPEKLAYSWEYAPEPPTIVTWTLEKTQGGTRLLLVHSGFGSEQLTDEYNTGWLNFLNQIKFLVEVGPTWSRPTHPTLNPSLI